MTDTQMLDWLEQHYTRFREEGEHKDGRYVLEWIGVERDNRVRGNSLRGCVLKILGNPAVRAEHEI